MLDGTRVHSLPRSLLPINTRGVGGVGGVEINAVTVTDQSVVCTPGVSSSTFTAINILHQKYQPPVLEEKQAFAVLQKASVYTYTQNSVHFFSKTLILKIICKKSSTETSLDN